MRFSNITSALAVVALVVAGCDSTNPVAPDANSDSAALSKKGGKPGDGGSSDNVPMLVQLAYPSGAPANALLDADDIAGRIGTEYTVGFTFDPYVGEFDDAGTWAESSACPAGYRFGILEVLGRGGELTHIILRGGDGNGTDAVSDKIYLDTPQVPDAENGFTLNVDLSVPVLQGKGKHKTTVCTVYIEDLVYTPV